ncbi:hypothetical protein [Lacinutrix venerupis]|uniref:CDP-glycerol glycerophosphotransferase (TagB/SpsB family) n=1 Tax=Lacinutrix venerupis TaxID=1486034 RepID=A0AAC9LNH8_9FLAO|nr:hypothetical protein [Lacinutrix venerupis]APY00725.1 hypothetical protein BWR22_10510 [Lacinutrix venerupis]
MSKIGIVIADGVGYRNFILSDFIKEAVKEYDEVVIYSGLIADVYTHLKFKNLYVRELDIFREKKNTWFYRKLKEVAHMKKHLSFFGIKTSYNNGKPEKINTPTSFLIYLAYIITKFFHSEKNIAFYEKLQFNTFKNNNIYIKYRDFLVEDKPDSLIFTHQRPYNLSPLLYAAQRLDIKTLSFIFSWDNLSSKGRMLGEFDGYLVWSDIMKKELKYFYPNTNSEKIFVVGTPQFETYVIDKYASDSNYFYNTFNLDKSKKTICYSCGDVSTSKLDPLYIEIIAKGIVSKEIEGVNFLVRTSPAEDESRFKDIIEKYPNIKWNFPNWELTRDNHVETWSQRVPSEKDLINLRSILMHCNLNINMCSTMSLDFMLFDKPVINIALGNEHNGLYNDQKYLNYNHYDKVVKSNAVEIIKLESNFYEAINESLINPKIRFKEQQELIKFEIGAPLKDTSKRIIKAMKTI